MTSLLFRSVFSPWNPASFQEKREMCRRLRNDEILRSAMADNGRCGMWERRVFLFIFRLRFYRILALICRILHIVWV